MLKVVVDTSVFVAGILSRSPDSSSYQILENWKLRAFTLVISPQLLRELVVVLLRRGISENDLEDLVEVISLIALQIPGAYETTILAGYFTSSLFEIAGEYLEGIDEVKIVCNSDVRSEDVKVAKVCESKLLGRLNSLPVEAESLLNKPRYQWLYQF